MSADGGNLVPRHDPDDAVGDLLDLGALFTSVVPGLGGAISNVLGGLSTERKLKRVREVLVGVAEDLRGFKSQVSEEYVKTEDFEDLLEEVFRRAARERSEAKRRLYRDFIVSTIRKPGSLYDERLELLETVSRLTDDHVAVLRAMAEMPPKQATYYAAAPLAVLESRIPSLKELRIDEIVTDLNRMGLTSLSSLRTTMTGHGAEDMRQAVTVRGLRVLGITS